MQLAQAQMQAQAQVAGAAGGQLEAAAAAVDQRARQDAMSAVFGGGQRILYPCGRGTEPITQAIGKRCGIHGKGGSEMSEKGYIGKIPNSGNMDVKAPHQQTQPKKGTVVKGNDLRTGKK